MSRTPRKEKIEIGWREWISLPEFGIARIKAKIDTGARTSALHAADLQAYEKNGTHWVSFWIPLAGLPREKRCSAHVVDERDIKNTSGKTERRYVVETTIVMGAQHWRVEFSLANRGPMTFEVILGRTAMRGARFIVNPVRSFLAGPPLQNIQGIVGNP